MGLLRSSPTLFAHENITTIDHQELTLKKGDLNTLKPPGNVLEFQESSGHF